MEHCSASTWPSLCRVIVGSVPLPLFFFNRRDIPRGDRISITSIHITKEREKNRRRKKENTSVLSQEGVDVESNQKIMTNVMIVMRFRQLEIVTCSEGDKQDGRFGARWLQQRAKENRYRVQGEGC